VIARHTAPFEVAHRYQPGQAPRDHHPAQWGRLERTRYLELGEKRWRVVVRSTARRHDGWSFNVIEMADFPSWVSYWHNGKSGVRVQSHRSGDAVAGQLAQAFELHEWG
jgi:hypothetical protein